MAVGGECRSVGIAGGYIFAGGHAPTSSKLGLGADGILEIQGILANGTTFTATPSQHQDLYWFLSGSGAGGTVAYIKSVTFRIFKDFSVSGSILTFNYTDVLTEKEFLAVHRPLAENNAQNRRRRGIRLCLLQDGIIPSLAPFCPNPTPAQIVTLLKHFTNALDDLETNHTGLT